MSATSPELRDLYWVNLSPVKGHEQDGHRPCLIVSPDWLNQGPSEMVFAVPLTTRFKNIETHVRIDPPVGDIERTSYIMPEQLRAISVDRLGKYIGTVPDDVLQEVREHLCMLLEL